MCSELFLLGGGLVNVDKLDMATLCVCKNSKLAHMRGTFLFSTYDYASLNNLHMLRWVARVIAYGTLFFGFHRGPRFRTVWRDIVFQDLGFETVLLADRD